MLDSAWRFGTTRGDDGNVEDCEVANACGWGEYVVPEGLRLRV